MTSHAVMTILDWRFLSAKPVFKLKAQAQIENKTKIRKTKKQKKIGKKKKMNSSNLTRKLIFVDPSFDTRTLVNYNYMNIVFTAIPAIVSLPCLFTILVFAHPKLNDPSFKILLTIAIADFLFLTLGVFSSIIDIHCQPMPFMCSSSVQYFTYLLDFFQRFYLGYCLSRHLS
jgi:hypothetical protein